MRVADAIADWLVAREITHAFGIIGGGNVLLFDAIHAKGQTEIVCCHHEQAAVMASTYFNRTRKRLASVVLCTTGAGSTNALTGVVAAWMDSIPVLIISGNEASKYMYQPTRVWGVQGYASCEAVFTYVKRAGRMASWNGDIDNSYEAAVSGRPGPVWLDIPKDVQGAKI